MFSADNISFRIEDGVARIDDIALVGRAATILAQEGQRLIDAKVKALSLTDIVL